MKTINKHASRNMLAAKNEYLECLATFFSEDKFPTSSFGAVGLTLIKVKQLDFEIEAVRKALAAAVDQTEILTPNTVTDTFVNIYPDILTEVREKTESDTTDIEATIDDAIRNLEKQDEQAIFYQYSSFCTHTLPLSKSTKKEIVSEFPNNKMTVSSIGEETLPWGGIPRIIILYLNTMAVLNGTDTISLGKNIKEFVESLDYKASYVEGGTNDQVMEQLEKLYRTEFSHERIEKIHLEDGSVEIKRHQKSFKIFDEKNTFELIKDNLSEKQEATVKLSATYFNELKAHPVPLSMDTIKALKKSPLGLDLYAFLSYRANTKKLIALKLTDLMKQFGIESETWRFKDNIKRALKLVQKQWPECNVVIKSNAMVILPTRTQIE